MTERQLAENICRVHAQTLVDANGGVTISGHTLGELYADRLNRAGGYDPYEVGENAMALRHWVASAGYDDNGHFVYNMADHKQNC